MSNSKEADSNLRGDQKYSWDDEKCLDLMERDYFPSHVFDISVQKEIIMQFLNFYLSGKVRKGMTISEVIFSVISIMPREQIGSMHEEFIWPSTEYKDNGTIFYISPEDKLNTEIKNLQLSNNNKNNDMEVHLSVASNDDNLNTTDDTENPGPSKELKASKQNDEEPNESHTENRKEIMSINHPEQMFSNYHEKNSESQSTHDHREDGKGSTSKSESDTREEDKLPSGIIWPCNKIYSKPIIVSYGPQKNAAFTKYCNSLLGQWHDSLQARVQLKSMFGYVALTLMRCTAKSPKHLLNTFCSERFLLSMRQLIPWYGPYSIPVKKCVSKSHRVLSKKDANVQIVFAKIVFHRNNIFNAAVLSHSYNYGMGILNMLQLLVRHIDKDIFYQVTSCDDTKVSWDNLKDFMVQYMVESNALKHVTYHWARILDNSAFDSLNCLNNYALSVIFAVFIEKELNNHKVWDAVWVAKNSDKLEDYKVLGEHMYKTYRDLYKVSFITDMESFKF